MWSVLYVPYIDLQFLHYRGNKLSPDSIKRCHLTSIGNPIVEIRQYYDRLISTMGFPIPRRRHLYIELGPWLSLWPSGVFFAPQCYITLHGINQKNDKAKNDIWTHKTLPKTHPERQAMGHLVTNLKLTRLQCTNSFCKLYIFVSLLQTSTGIFQLHLDPIITGSSDYSDVANHQQLNSLFNPWSRWKQRQY